MGREREGERNINFMGRSMHGSIDKVCAYVRTCVSGVSL